MESKGQSGVDLGVTGAPLPSLPAIAAHETRHSNIDSVQSWENKSTFMHSIDTIVRNAFSASEKGAYVHEVAFDITWQIQRCIRDELDGNPDLGAVLTVTGNSQHAWATSCYEYVHLNWKEADRGEQFLMDLEILLGKKFPISEQQLTSKLRGALCSIDEENSEVSRLVFRGTVAEISMLGQFLSWIAASFRLPRPGEVACSSVDFQHASKQGEGLRAFSIGLRDLVSLEDCPGTCWKALFPSTVMACDFPVPSYPGTLGLRIPFEAMLNMADILYDVNLEDNDGNDAGVYFAGILYTLYPTAYIQDHHVIQWHLEPELGHPKSDRYHPVSPDIDGAPQWVRIPNLERLRSAIAILGYCNEVQMQLGTAARASYHKGILASQAHIERPPPEITGEALNLGFNIMGHLNIGTATTWRTRNGVKKRGEGIKKADYIQMLIAAAERSVILCDTEPEDKRAWMVPELSLILEAFNVWVYKNEIENIKYTNPGSDGGKEAKDVPGDINYANRVVVQRVPESESDKQIGDIIKGIYASI